MTSLRFATTPEGGGGADVSATTDSVDPVLLLPVVEKTSGALLAATPQQQQHGAWDTFDYLQHWYPVSWVCDLRPNQPTKVSLFDVDYVIAVDDNSMNTKITALRDQCPHKGAALSEGRITASGFLQCAYHGWSFDGATGACQQIPQAAAAAAAGTTCSGSSSSPVNYSARTCATAIPAVIHQGMLWLWPGRIRHQRETYPTPPTVPELDDPAFQVTRVVRDFPTVDWTLLISNVLDPDHGLFAHQMPPFDWYSASAEYPMTVTESFPKDDDDASASAGWHLKTTVVAVEKLLQRDKALRGTTTTKTKERPFFLGGSNKKEAAPTPPLATSTFEAPTTITLSRRSDTTAGETKFVSGFWVCPSGTGRSRFFSASISKVPKWIKVPRWFFHMNLNNFLDQDTVLVASQQPHVLTAEAEGKGRCSGSLFAYASPSDRSVRLLDQFWDATTPKAPNRSAVLQELHRSGQLRHTPDRRVVLDREAQHLAICPDSQDTVRNCIRIRNASLTVAASWIAASMVKRAVLPGKWLFVTSLVAAWASESLRKTFYFFYPETKRNRDLKNIPSKMWSDPR